MSAEKIKHITHSITTIPNFPKEGILFRDITSLFADPLAFQYAMDLTLDIWADKNVTCILALEARGFLLGSVLANALGVSLILARKKGKLPRKVISESYTLEYGNEILEVHEDSFSEIDKVLIVDDLVATGGTAIAAANLVSKLSAEVVGCTFIIDLPDLGGSNRLKELGYECSSLISFEGL